MRRLRDTLIEADRGFLATLDPARAAAELVDDRYVKRAIEAVGGLGRFGFPGELRPQRAGAGVSGTPSAAARPRPLGSGAVAPAARAVPAPGRGAGQPRRPRALAVVALAWWRLHRRAAGRRRDGARRPARP